MTARDDDRAVGMAAGQVVSDHRPTGHVVVEVYEQHPRGIGSCGAAVASMPSDPARRSHALALTAFAALRQLAIETQGSGAAVPDHVMRRVRHLLDGLEPPTS